MKGDFHVRFRENVGVKFPCVTRLAVMLKKNNDEETNLHIFHSIDFFDFL